MIWLVCCVHYKISEFHMGISNSNFTQIIERFDHEGLHQQKDEVGMIQPGLYRADAHMKSTNHMYVNTYNLRMYKQYFPIQIDKMINSI